jgi:hypothetical protein
MAPMRDTGRSWGDQPARLVLSACVVVLAAAVILVVGAGHHKHPHTLRPVRASRPVVLAPIPTTLATTAPTPTPSTPAASPSTRQVSSQKGTRVPQQDPQDRRGSPAAKRAARALASHRALQHIPYRHGPVSITLTGALPDGKAILIVTAPTLREARAGWRRFLARYHDNGRAYQPHFEAIGRPHG